MALFLQKPVFWNTRNYEQPSGVQATSGFPKDHGFGHEEWNNSPRLRLLDRKKGYRVFHTEEVGNAPVDSNFGQNFVFMTASHDGIQQLVGVAANAASLISSRPWREDIVKKLELDGLCADVWEVPQVRECFEHSKRAFNQLWKLKRHWIPTWICPEEYFMWLDEPVTLDPKRITGKKRLLGMYLSHTTLDRRTAQLFMDAVPQSMRNERWTLIVDAIQTAPSTPAFSDEIKGKDALVTEVLAQSLARRGQGQFRESLHQAWDRACAVTRVDCPSVLKASHIKPWAKSRDNERLDPNNGLLLCANLDALFDKGLITFEDNGDMRVSADLTRQQQKALGLPMGLCKPPTPAQQRYLKHHRDKEFERWK